EEKEEEKEDKKEKEGNKSNQSSNTKGKRNKKRKKNKGEFFLYDLTPQQKKSKKSPQNATNNPKTENKNTLKEDTKKTSETVEKSKEKVTIIEQPKTIKNTLTEKINTPNSNKDKIIYEVDHNNSRRYFDYRSNKITQSQSITYHGNKKRRSGHGNRRTNGYMYNNYYCPHLLMMSAPFQIIPSSGLMPTAFEKSSDDFFYKISKEIYSFVDKVGENIDLLNKYRIKKLTMVEGIIKQCLDDNYSYELIYYGSFATNLSIEASDIDLLVNFKTKETKPIKEKAKTPFTPDYTKISQDFILIQALDNFLNLYNARNEGTFEYINAIYTASVPVIKLSCDISKEISKEDKEKISSKFEFEIEEINTVKFDITFHEIVEPCSLTTGNISETNSISSSLHSDNLSNSSANSKNTTGTQTAIGDKDQIHSVEIINFIKDCVERYPEIKYMLLVLKRYFKILKLNNSFKGGISSYSLFLLILAFLKYENFDSVFLNFKGDTIKNYAKELYIFFDFYSNMDYNCVTIQPGEGSPFIQERETHEGIVILDPITCRNVSKSSFKVEEIKNAFIQGREFFKQSFIKFDSPEQNEFNNSAANLLNMFFNGHY
ncbi:MAG: nucleotidyltransferase domain-containing protein, partial [archaeon]|nr:nucleotidyltransferase domain-containing protein [archaeon]